MTKAKLPSLPDCAKFMKDKLVVWHERPGKGPEQVGLVLMERTEGLRVQVLDFSGRAYDLAVSHVPWSRSIRELQETGLDALVLRTCFDRNGLFSKPEDARNEWARVRTHEGPRVLDLVAPETIARLCAASPDTFIALGEQLGMTDMGDESFASRRKRFYGTAVDAFVASEHYDWRTLAVALAYAQPPGTTSLLDRTSDLPRVQRHAIERVYAPLIMKRQGQREHYLPSLAEASRQTKRARKLDVQSVVHAIRRKDHRLSGRENLDELAGDVIEIIRLSSWTCTQTLSLIDPGTWAIEVWEGLMDGPFQKLSEGDVRQTLSDHWEMPYLPALVRTLSATVPAKGPEARDATDSDLLFSRGFLTHEMNRLDRRYPIIGQDVVEQLRALLPDFRAP